jgi:hypothetical protein
MFKRVRSKSIPPRKIKEVISENSFVPTVSSRQLTFRDWKLRHDR